MLRPGDDPDFDNELQTVDKLWSVYQQGVIAIGQLEGSVQEKVNELVVGHKMKTSEAYGKSVLTSELSYQKTMLTDEELDDFDQLMLELKEEKASKSTLVRQNTKKPRMTTADKIQLPPRRKNK